MGLLEVALDPATVVVAVDPGKVMNRVRVSNGANRLEEPASLPVARSGIAALEKMLATHAGERVIAIEATGSLHRAWAVELEQAVRTKPPRARPVSSRVLAREIPRRFSLSRGAGGPPGLRGAHGVREQVRRTRTR